MKPKVALQLWSVKEACQQDFIGTLKLVKEMGYDGVEFAGYYGLSATELSAILTELDLAVAGSHIGYDQIVENLDEVIAYEKAIGNERIICPYVAADTFEEWQERFAAFREAQEKIAAAGLTLIYHNHSHEFTAIPDKSILEEMVAAVPGIKLEVDTYWVQHAGLNVVEWLLENRQSVALLHIKEMLIVDGEKESTEIGTGILPIASYVNVAKELDLPWLIVEQEAFQKYPAIESAAINVVALKKIIEEVY